MRKIVLMVVLMAMSACAPGNKGTKVQRMAKVGDEQKGMVTGEVPTQKLGKVEKDAKGKATGVKCVDLKSLAESLNEVPNQSFVVTTQLIAVSEAAQFQDLVEGKVFEGNDALLAQVLKTAANQKNLSLLPRRDVLTMRQIQKMSSELSVVAQEACDNVTLQSTDTDGKLESYKIVSASANAISVENSNGIVRYFLGRSNYDFRIERIQRVTLDVCGKSKEAFVRVATSYLPVDKASPSNKVDVEFLNQLLGLVEGAADYQPPMAQKSVNAAKSTPPRVKSSSMTTMRRENTINNNSLEWLYTQVQAGLIKTESCQKE